MADSYTQYFNLTKPEVGASRDQWGSKWNTNLDALDGILNTLALKTGVPDKFEIKGTAPQLVLRDTNHLGALVVADSNFFQIYKTNVDSADLVGASKLNLNLDTGTLSAAGPIYAGAARLDTSGDIFMPYAGNVWLSTVLDGKMPKTGGTFSGDIRIQKGNAALSLVYPGVKHSQWFIDGNGTMFLRDGDSGALHFYVTSGGAAWFAQFGDLNSRIEQRASDYSNGAYNSAVAVANARVHRIQFTGYGEIAGTNGDMAGSTPNVFFSARGTQYGAQVFGTRTLQQYLPDAGGWVNAFG